MRDWARATQWIPPLPLCASTLCLQSVMLGLPASPSSLSPCMFLLDEVWWCQKVWLQHLLLIPSAITWLNRVITDLQIFAFWISAIDGSPMMFSFVWLHFNLWRTSGWRQTHSLCTHSSSLTLVTFICVPITCLFIIAVEIGLVYQNPSAYVGVWRVRLDIDSAVECKVEWNEHRERNNADVQKEDQSHECKTDTTLQEAKFSYWDEQVSLWSLSDITALRRVCCVLESMTWWCYGFHYRNKSLRWANTVSV